MYVVFFYSYCVHSFAEVTKIMTYLAQASHDLVPPEVDSNIYVCTCSYTSVHVCTIVKTFVPSPAYMFE